MTTIDAKIDNIEENGGWGHRYFLINPDNSLSKISISKLRSGDFSSIKNIQSNKEYPIISVSFRNLDGQAAMIFELNDYYIKLNENKRFNGKQIGVYPSAQTSLFHTKLVIKDIFKHSTHAYISMRTAIRPPLVREVKLANIDKIIPNCTSSTKPLGLREKLEFSKNVAEKEHQLNYICAIQQMYEREINLGINVDREFYNELAKQTDKPAA